MKPDVSQTSLKRFARSLCACAFMLVLLGGTAFAAPALWVAESGNAKVYLFGTVHVLRPDTQWHTKVLDTALAESSDLWLELSNPDDAVGMAALVQSLGTDVAHPLSTKISSADVARIDADVKAVGGTGEAALEPYRPWLASITLSMVPIVRAGYDPKSGVDVQLKSAFSAASKPIRGLEKAEQQMHFFADLPQDQEVAMLHATLDQVDTAAKTLDDLVGAWAAGNVDGVASLIEKWSFRNAPQLYDMLIVRRNADWVQQLDARLRQPGTSFVAVGAAHLAGPSSVQAGLEKLGYTIRRVQ